MRTPQAGTRRSWSHEDLRIAVATQQSWRGVARALGLRATSTNNLRRHVARLGLDTSHFTGRRLWTDQRLSEAVALSSSWAEVLKQLGLPDTSGARARAKGHATRLGLDCSRLTPRQPAAPSPALPAPRPVMLRNAATAIAIAWFNLRGCDAALPMEPKPYDLLVTLPEGVRRVQVKSGTRRSASGKWLVSVAHRPYSMDKSAGRAPYDPDSLDYFFAVDGDGGLYLIPCRALAGRVEITLDHYRGYRIGDGSSLLTWTAG